MKKIIVAIMGLIQLIFAFTVIDLTGKVTDENGNGLGYVNIYFMDTLEGTMTDEIGNFKISTQITHDRKLRISHIGFEQQDVVISPNRNDDFLQIVLKKEFMELSPVSVTAGSFTMADEEGQTLTSLDVVTTAGAAADIFRAVQTFPGVNQVDEGAGMYVRGGDVSETTVILDQATISHPYKYESDTGGYFGMIDPWLLSGTYFSTGGFSVKYGNVLSGVLAMESLDMPSRSSLTIGAGLAAVSLGGAWLSQSEKLAVQFSGNYSNTKYLFQLNGGSDRFEQVPQSWDGNISTIWKYSNFGQVKIFYFKNDDDIAVRVNHPNYNGIMMNDNHSQLANIQWRHLFEQGILVKSSVSTNQFSQGLTLGNIDKRLTDNLWKWRTDVTIPAGDRVTINTGLILDDLVTDLQARFPRDENDIHPDAETDTFQVDYQTQHYGTYIETEVELTSRLMIISGIRGDFLTDPKQQEYDPRLSVNYRLSNTQFLKIATGIYHQYPKAQYRDSYVGNPNLGSMKAVHYILGYEYKSDVTDVKAEIYRKHYNNLVLENDESNYTNDGNGYAYGADLFVKGTLPFISGWVSYSYLQSKRKELEYQKLVPTDYDINHNLTAALKTQLGASHNIGLTYRYTTGKPYTPALNNWNSSRLPAMQRLDLSYSKLYPIGLDGLLVIYVSVSNLLDRSNIYGYLYSSDYSERTELKSTHGRNIYFGFSATI